ncbi:hypothetical protein [Nannocystis sp.]|uniref:hypothetical protein n=1 Tax=Nannocystis sp. TaxID=1962667 RepID=UPI0024255635|nr:hypothetical protein [Nannocystis sp.]MBK7828859.1 hypothetical protein [Nannocystis sp.]MBK9756566.1 hypothetical protein [Nannocystis sp.]
MRMQLSRLGLALLLAGSATLASACEGSELAATPAQPWPTGLPRPPSAAEASALKASGVAWTDPQVRQFYLDQVAKIADADAELQRAGKSVEARARAAFTARHEARMTARAMMQDAAAVEALRARDREKYNSPDGPTFEYLLERAQQKGLTGDAIFQSIIDSAQRTDAATNRSMGL